MKPIIRDPRALLFHGDALEIDRTLPPNSVDALVEDPPYGLGFMGKDWDHDVPGVPFWQAALRVMKPGAHGLVFGGTRKYHRQVCAIEDAGFEIRDCLMWLYGSGFPKSLNVSKAIDKRRDDTDEVRIVCRYLRAAMGARGLSSAKVAEQFGMHSRMVEHWAARDTDSQPTCPTLEQWERLRALVGFGSDVDELVTRLNGRKGTLGEAWELAEILGTEIMPDTSVRPGFQGERYSDSTGATRTVEIKAPNSEAARRWDGWGTALKPAWEPIILFRKPLEGTVAQNVLRWGTGGLNIDGCRIGTADNLNGRSESDYVQPEGRWPANVTLDEAAAQALDAQSGIFKSGELRAGRKRGHGVTSYDLGGGIVARGYGYGDTGGASRFFYVAKAARKERDLGLGHLPPRSGGEATDREDGTDGLNSPRAGAGRGGGARNFHPTVKPVSLMRYLIRLLTPPGGVVLDRFGGSGSTAVAALEEGFAAITVEKTDDYLPIIEGRIRAALARTAAGVRSEE